MSQKNLEMLHGIYEGIERGNFAATEKYLDPEVEWRWTSDQMGLTGKRSFRGLDEIRKGMGEWLGTWESFWVEPEEFRDAGDRAVVFVCVHARLKGSAVDVETRQADVYTFRNEKILCIEKIGPKPSKPWGWSRHGESRQSSL
jgi:ketosteroid isomerase-like protein